MRAVAVRITGKVQGVSFRAYAAQEAVRLEVAGWVLNADDRSVEARLEGTDSQVAEMIDWLHRGSPGARVDEVVVTEVAADGLGSFEVRY